MEMLIKGLNSTIWAVPFRDLLIMVISDVEAREIYFKFLRIKLIDMEWHYQIIKLWFRN